MARAQRDREAAVRLSPPPHLQPRTAFNHLTSSLAPLPLPPRRCLGQDVGPSASFLPVPASGALPCLFDLEADSGEHHDLSAEQVRRSGRHG